MIIELKYWHPENRRFQVMGIYPRSGDLIRSGDLTIRYGLQGSRLSPECFLVSFSGLQLIIRVSDFVLQP